MNHLSRCLLLLLGLSSMAPLGRADEAPPWERIDKVFGVTGKALPGEVHRYAWP